MYVKIIDAKTEGVFPLKTGKSILVDAHQDLVVAFVKKVILLVIYESNFTDSKGIGNYVANPLLQLQLARRRCTKITIQSMGVAPEDL